MKKQTEKSVRVDQTLIKQFARRIYYNMKAFLQADREQAERLLQIIFETAQIEIGVLGTRAPQTGEYLT